MAEALASGAAPLAEERDSRVLAQLAPLLAPLAAFSYSSYARAAAGDKPSGKSPGCEVFVLARDGVELSAPRLQARVLVSPGSRAELLVRCSSAGIFDLRTDPPKVGFSDWTHIGTGSDIASGALMRLAVLADSAAGPPPARDALRYGAEASNGGSPGHAADETYAAAAEHAQPARGLYATMDLQTAKLPSGVLPLHIPMLQGKVPIQRPGGREAGQTFPYAWYGMRDREYNEAEGASRTVTLGATEEWKLINERTLNPATQLPSGVPPPGTPLEESPLGESLSSGAFADGNHPFHMHVNHFQIVAINAPARSQQNGANGGGINATLTVAATAAIDYEVGDWRDTISIPTPGSVTIRWQANDFVGKAMAHCHIFGHSDTGMSMDFEVLGI